MSQQTIEAWAGPRLASPTPIPSWIAPRMQREEPEPEPDAPVVVTIPPADAARIYSLHPPAEPPPPAPPPYPDLRGECDALRAALVASVEATTEVRRQILQATEPALVALACAIGSRIAGRELAGDPEIVVGWVKEAIERLGARAPVVVAVSADVAASLTAAAWSPLASDSVAIETDAALGPSSIEVRAPGSTTDASLRGRAEAIAAEVTRTSP